MWAFELWMTRNILDKVDASKRNKPKIINTWHFEHAKCSKSVAIEHLFFECFLDTFKGDYTSRLGIFIL